MHYILKFLNNYLVWDPYFVPSKNPNRSGRTESSRAIGSNNAPKSKVT